MFLSRHGTWRSLTVRGVRHVCRATPRAVVANAAGFLVVGVGVAVLVVVGGPYVRMHRHGMQLGMVVTVICLLVALALLVGFALLRRRHIRHHTLRLLAEDTLPRSRVPDHFDPEHIQ